MKKLTEKNFLKIFKKFKKDSKDKKLTIKPQMIIFTNHKDK
jgi:hypothetical protein